MAEVSVLAVYCLQSVTNTTEREAMLVMHGNINNPNVL